MMSTKSRQSVRCVRSPAASFLEEATLFADGDSFFEAVRDSETENPKSVVVLVEDGRLPASSRMAPKSV